MLMITIFCVCVTMICCYTVNMILNDRAKNNKLTYNQIIQKDIRALNRPLKFVIRHEHNFNAVQKSNKDKLDFFDQLLNVTPAKNTNVNNYYPIRPKKPVSTGYGFDVRV